MTHRTSRLGIIGLGALGRAVESFLDPATEAPSAVLFCVKAFDLKEALLEQQPLWPDHVPFVTLSNGFIRPIVEEVLPKVGRRPIRVGMTTIGSTINRDNSINIYSDGSLTAWGKWNLADQDASIGELAVLKRFPNGTWHKDIRPLIRSKWVVNTVVNSIAAAHGLPRNELIKNHRSEVEILLLEAYELSSRLWTGLDWDVKPDALLHKIWNIIDATAANENSMARDKRLHRQTESSFLAGMAKEFQGFPNLKAIHQLVSSE